MLFQSWLRNLRPQHIFLRLRHILQLLWLLRLLWLLKLPVARVDAPDSLQPDALLPRGL